MTVVARDNPLHPGDRSTCPFATADATLDTLPNPGDEGTSPLAPPPALARWREEEPVRRISVPGGRTAWLVTRHEDARTAHGANRLSSERDRPGLSPAQRRRSPDAVTSVRITCSSVSTTSPSPGGAEEHGGEQHP
ncbi:hypothetical protein GCM10017771_44960 [Streptomyces capitiformicae]|uniref:Uncharacterized protein n=1 Tax=Streptomyces capitiformicae TaxID=2014920 RepID=A0A918YYQ7_9ACTN|nr:hypothetical protein GCM10017771_44960 [Streptomyces capitiformicae]